ncbi:MAG: TonB family protein [Calditrichaeota bacterium]|nr:MAG: TonB family protein [Calditrichota bacterium]
MAAPMAKALNESDAMDSKFLTRMWLNISEQKLQRNLTGLSVSVFVHIALIFLYWGIAAFDQPEILEIREISFVDMTEAPPMPVEPKAARLNLAKMETAPIAIPKQKERIKNEIQPVVNRKPSENRTQTMPVVALNRRLDMERTQAPLAATPISLSKKNQTDVLKLSQAQGTRKDEKVINPAAPIQLKRAQISKAATNFNHTGSPINKNKPKINLAKRKPTLKSGYAGSNQDQFSAVTKAKSGSIQINRKKSGVTITGPLGSRQILKRNMPDFPEWAKQKGVGATIALQFTVMENGAVKENIIVFRTSGSREWDEIVKAALKKWRFAPLQTGGRRQDQTGVITFQFVVN